MKALIKLPIPSFLIVLILALASKVQAVSPPPDGGYPGGNTAEGQSALASLSSGGFNTAVGFLSLKSNTTNSFNTAIGAGALLANAADENTAVGAGALLSNTIGVQNTANGALALFSNTFGGVNAATGALALFNNTTGQFNTANGAGALANSTTGSGNTGIGSNTLFHNTTGSNNIALGSGAGMNLTTGNNNIDIVDPGVAGEAGTIRIGIAGIQTATFIAGIRGVTTGNNDAIPVLIDSAGQLGTASSSRRYKTDIKPMEKASESILALKPVSFRYKIHKSSTPQFGLIAEDVAEVNPNLVIYDADGKPYTVRYDAVNAMLLNEFLKEHRKVEQLEKQIEALTAGLQNVSAQLELSKSAPQTVLNNR